MQVCICSRFKWLNNNYSKIENRRHLQRIEKSGKQISDLIENPMIYTYIDEDDFNPAKVYLYQLLLTYLTCFRDKYWTWNRPRSPISVLPWTRWTTRRLPKMRDKQKSWKEAIGSRVLCYVKLLLSTCH